MDPVADLTARAALVLLFLVAAAHKLRDRGRFRATLADYRLLPAALVPAAGVFFPAIEAALAATLVVPALRAPGLAGAAALLAVYSLGIAINLARGRRDLDCGCAGPAARRPISGWLVARNVTLAAAALALLAPVRARTLVWVDGLTVLGGTTALAALHAAFDGLLVQVPVMARLRGDA